MTGVIKHKSNNLYTDTKGLYTDERPKERRPDLEFGEIDNPQAYYLMEEHTSATRDYVTVREELQ